MGQKAQYFLLFLIVVCIFISQLWILCLSSTSVWRHPEHYFTNAAALNLNIVQSFHMTHTEIKLKLKSKSPAYRNYKKIIWSKWSYSFSWAILHAISMVWENNRDESSFIFPHYSLRDSSCLCFKCNGFTGLNTVSLVTGKHKDVHVKSHCTPMVDPHRRFHSCRLIRALLRTVQVC